MDKLHRQLPYWPRSACGRSNGARRPDFNARKADPFGPRVAVPCGRTARTTSLSISVHSRLVGGSIAFRFGILPKVFEIAGRRSCSILHIIPELGSRECNILLPFSRFYNLSSRHRPAVAGGSRGPKPGIFPGFAPLAPAACGARIARAAGSFMHAACQGCGKNRATTARATTMRTSGGVSLRTPPET
jgi:hypothetical protein